MRTATDRVEHAPADVAVAIRQVKAMLRNRIGDVHAAFAVLESLIAKEVAEIEAIDARGEGIWPVIDFADIAAGAVSQQLIDQLHRRGCVVVRGHFPHETAMEWDRRLVDYVERNDFDKKYRGPGDNFFGTVGTSRPPIYPIYWSRPQVEARQHDRMATVQSFLNRQWKFQSQGTTWFDPDQDVMYVDRIRRRPPGTTSSGLGAHTDSGALERWLLPAYQHVFRHVFDGNIEAYDPWDAAHRTEVNEYAGGTTMCSAFRTFQGWTALSDIASDQGVLFTVPIPTAMAYILLRPLLDDVADDDLCGVTLRQVLPVNNQWHPLLMRAASTIPHLRAGDSVWWHCDLVHGVAPVTDQQGWGNVMYIPSAPMCDKNAEYARTAAQSLATGRSPADFPEEHYETDWEDRATTADLNHRGRRALGIGS